MLLVSAASAAAATIPVEGGEVDWGVKESFRSYIKGPIAAGKIETLRWRGRSGRRRPTCSRSSPGPTT